MSNAEGQEFADEVVHFLVGAIDKTNSMVQHIDDQTNILIGVGTAIFVFATTRYDSAANKLTFLVLGIFAAVSAITGLFALHPPKFMRKKGQVESLLFPSHIARTGGADKYISAMTATAKSQSKIVEECSRELYNMSHYYYLPKRRLYRFARNLLMIGIALAFIIFILRTSS